MHAQNLRLMFGATALAAMALTANPVSAHRAWPVIGGRGDATTTVMCPPGEQIVGFEGRTGLWIDQVRLECAKQIDAATMGAPHPVGDGLGGFGGAANRVVCGRKFFIHSLGMIYTHNQNQVVAIHMSCASLTGTSGSYTGFGGSYNAVEDPCEKTATCGPDTDQVHSICPNERFTGVTARVGKDVNALGFICDPVPFNGAAAPVKTTGKPSKH
jgi:hypothetical protein